MTMPDMSSIYIPRPLAVKELNLSDDWRGRWIDEKELPENAPVNYVYAIVVMAERGYLTRHRGEAVWRTVEGPIGEGEKPDALVRRAAKEQVGATVRFTELLGFIECKATSHNRDYPVGTITVRPMYLVIAKKVDDLPAGSAFEKRRLPINEYMMALRGRYPEFVEYFVEAGQRFAVLRAKGEA